MQIKPLISDVSTKAGVLGGLKLEHRMERVATSKGIARAARRNTARRRARQLARETLSQDSNRPR